MSVAVALMRGLARLRLMAHMATRARVPLALVPLACVVMALVAVAPDARAQGRPEIRASVDRDVVEIGDVVHLSLSAMSSEAMPSSPQPGATPGFRVRGTSVAPSQSISIVNGVRTDRQGINATWTLQAEKVGSYSVGPVSVVVDGKRHETQRVTLKIVPKGQAPQTHQTQPGAGIFGPGFTPFDPWKGLLNPFGDDAQDPQRPRMPQGPPADPRLALDAPRGDVAFLHASIDKTRAVVGEQVTLTVYLYVDEGSSEPDFQDAHEVTAGDFLKKPLMEDEKTQRLVGYAEIAGRRYGVRVIRKSALFPLKAGELEIGPMTLAVLSGGRSGSRETERLKVHVTEPPVAGRPPGYALGDVGKFSLSAEVAPRVAERGGAVAVTVELTGTGNLPSALAPPVRGGVEWLDPDVREKLGATDGQHFGGKRTFSFVVRMKQEGVVDLGTFALPYWDADAKAYAVARADLGAVQVRPGAPGSAAASAAEEPPDPLPGLPAPRGSLGGTKAVGAHLADTPLFWVGLAAPTLAYAFVFGAHAATRKVRARMHLRASSPEADLRARIAAAEAACAGEHPRLAYAAIVRAVEGATQTYAQVNVRGIPVHEVAAALQEQGIDGPPARAIQALLEACGSARFSPEGDDIDSARSRWADAQRAFKALRSA